MIFLLIFILKTKVLYGPQGEASEEINTLPFFEVIVEFKTTKLSLLKLSKDWGAEKRSYHRGVDTSFFFYGKTQKNKKNKEV